MKMMLYVTGQASLKLTLISAERMGKRENAITCYRATAEVRTPVLYFIDAPSAHQIQNAPDAQRRLHHLDGPGQRYLIDGLSYRDLTNTLR